jgi:hypothetical protein
VYRMTFCYKIRTSAIERERLALQNFCDTGGMAVLWCAGCPPIRPLLHVMHPRM